MIPETMKAVVLTEPTKGEDIRLAKCPVPKVCPGWVLVKVKAFGMNHSEQILRQGEIQADYIKKPVIPGIECVGEIADPSDSSFKKGQKVAALMGGMGRSFNGSYGEYALLPAHHVFSVSSSLSWTELAAVPETYFTAWGSLFQGLDLKPSDTLLIRGATCALGYAAVQIGKALGCKVIATAHREENIDTEKNFFSLFTAVNKMAEKYDMPVLYSCHPRSRNRLASSGFKLDRRVIQHEPLGFHDYNNLQMNAFAVVSDSGTLPEESSFFTSVGHPFPAVCIRTSTERPEALDKACFILAGIDEKSLLQAVDVAVNMNEAGDYGIPVPDYIEENVSTKVVKIIQSYTGIVNKMVWRKY